MNPPPTKLTKHETESMWVVILSNNLEEGEREPQRERGGRRRGGGGTRERKREIGGKRRKTQRAHARERGRETFTQINTKFCTYLGTTTGNVFYDRGEESPPPLPL